MTINKRIRRRERVMARPSSKSCNLIVTRKHYEGLKNKFKEEHIDFVVAVNDAEKACAWLNMTSVVDIVVTDDYDALAFGAKYIVRNSNKTDMELIDRDKILKLSGFTNDEFVKFCILSGQISRHTNSNWACNQRTNA